VKRMTLQAAIMTAIAICMFMVSAGVSNTACINHGDVNLDGTVTAADAQQAFYIVLGLYSPTYEEECAADCNGDGSVTAADAQAIFLVVLGLGDCADPLVSPGGLYSSDAIVGNLRFVPAGEFLQGSPDSESCRLPNEGPQFSHVLSNALAVMETGVTRRMWNDLKSAQPTLPVDPSYTQISPTEDHPVQSVSWRKTILYANLLSLQSGHTRCYYKNAGFTVPVDADNYASGDIFCNFNADGFRLPTEGEREYSCRAGTTGPFSTHEPAYGDSTCNSCSPSPPLTVLDSIAWWCGNTNDMAEPAGLKAGNAWNLKDTHGNVNEWCWDWYSDYPVGSQQDYAGPVTGTNRVTRGGEFDFAGRFCRSASRTGENPDSPNPYLGFRLVRTIQQ
jgi:formylglycine-generating enzyme required for sulfatase activity